MATSRRLGIRSFHLLENARDQAIRLGEWDWIAAELAAVLEEEGDALDRTSALVGTIMIQAYRGASTAERLAELEALPMSSDDTVKPVSLAEAEGAIAFADGRYDLARTRNVEMGELFLQSRLEARLLAARCALLAGDVAAARDDLAMAGTVERRGRTIAAGRTTIEAGLAALDGRARDALGLYREALREWRDMGLEWDEALCALDMAMLLDPADPEVSAAAESARVILVGLGATPFLDRLETAMARPGTAGDAAARVISGGQPEEIAEARH
jgi:tetratricopeptide (TPR) repeat protein